VHYTRAGTDLVTNPVQKNPCLEANNPSASHEISMSHFINPLTPNDLQRRRAVSHLKIKIPSKKSRQAVLRGRI
jgi:hypothetical protein